jgi:hypothetical protein
MNQALSMPGFHEFKRPRLLGFSMYIDLSVIQVSLSQTYNILHEHAFKYRLNYDCPHLRNPHHLSVPPLPP